jgi:adenosylhomocysteine nucleosidase
MIGLIAVRNEAKPLLQEMQVETTRHHLHAQFYQGHLAGCSVILAQVAPGKVQAAAATQHLIDRYGVKLMASCGSAGGLSPQVQVGDVILVDRVVLHDFGLHTEAGFQHLGCPDPNYPDGRHYQRALRVDPQLVATIQQTAGFIEWPSLPPNIITGCLASGDQVIAVAAKKQWLYQTFAAVAVDMETGAMAQVAALNQVPWLAVRALSDKADAALDVGQLNFITFSDEPTGTIKELQKTAQNALHMAQKPGQVKALFNLRQAIQQAAANAATATTAIIAQLD